MEQVSPSVTPEPVPLGVGPGSAIEIDDDDDLSNDKDRKVNSIWLARMTLTDRKFVDPVRRSVKSETSSLSGEDFEQAIFAEEELSKDIYYVDLTGEAPGSYPAPATASTTASFSRPPSTPLHRFELIEPQLRLENGEMIQTGNIVALKEPLDRFKIQFIKVHVIIRNTQNGQVRVRGWPYTRSKNLDGKLLRKLNEVCLIGHVDEEDPRPWIDQALIDVWESDISHIRRGLRTTNAPFPQMRFGDSTYARMGKKWVEEHETLVCRYHYYLLYRDVIKKKMEIAHHWVLLHVNEDMADREYRIRDATKINDWRGGKVPGGSYCGHGIEPEIVSVDDDEDCEPCNIETGVEFDTSIKRRPGQKYTVGDVFSGSGGASRGIQQAGLKLVFAVDHWRTANNTYEMNFQDVDCYLMEVDQFIANPDIRYRVDVVHLSPPCQVWSPAHTIMGQNDDKNMAALLSCTEIIKKIRPRVFTLEQTFGMLHSRFELFFSGLVGGFTDHGYSVRWSVINFNTWGLCQPRRRLVMIGACPGEALPDFPSPTHGLGRGMLPLTTARQAISHLRSGDDHHNPGDMPLLVNARVWDPDTPLPHTITCSGGHNNHWDGMRDFTIREYAALQGFPGRHRFRGAYLKRQIGNAFPPSMARRLFEHIRDFLERADRVTGPRIAAPPSVPMGPVIDLDDVDSPLIKRASQSAPDFKSEGSSIKSDGDVKPRIKPKTFVIIDDDDNNDDDAVFGVFQPHWRGRGGTRQNPVSLDEEHPSTASGSRARLLVRRSEASEELSTLPIRRIRPWSPAVEMVGPAVEMVGSAFDMVGSALERVGSAVEMVGPPAEMAGPVEMVGPAVEMVGSAVEILDGSATSSETVGRSENGATPVAVINLMDLEE